MATLEQAQKEHSKAVEYNRDLGIVEYKSRQKQAKDVVYEVVEGCKRLPGGHVLPPGARFHPTEKQVRDGSLRGKARELTASEYRGLKVERQSFAGADIGVRSIPMTESALRAALAAGLTEEDFDGLEGDGAEGRFTKPQVDALIEAKAVARAA